MAYLKVDGKYVSVNGKLLHVPINPSGGIDTSDATATSADITNGKTAYVNGEKLVGTHNCGTTSPQNKIVVPKKARQVVIPDDGYHLGQVLVEAIPAEYIIPSGSRTIIANGTYDVTEIASVTVNTIQPVLAPATATASDIKTGKTAYDEDGNIITGTHECSDIITSFDSATGTLTITEV